MYPIQIKNKNKKLYIERTFTKKVHNLAKLFSFSITPIYIFFDELFNYKYII